MTEKSMVDYRHELFTEDVEVIRKLVPLTNPGRDYVLIITYNLLRFCRKDLKGKMHTKREIAEGFCRQTHMLMAIIYPLIMACIETCLLTYQMNNLIGADDRCGARHFIAWIESGRSSEK